MRASTARLTNSPVRLADLQFPQVNRLIHRTRLAFIHLENLLAYAKRDRDGRIDGYLAAHLPDECVLLFFRKGEAVNAASLSTAGRQVITITDALKRMRTEVERGDLCGSRRPARPGGDGTGQHLSRALLADRGRGRTRISRRGEAPRAKGDRGHRRYASGARAAQRPARHRHPRWRRAARGIVECVDGLGAPAARGRGGDDAGNSHQGAEGCDARASLRAAGRRLLRQTPLAGDVVTWPAPSTWLRRPSETSATSRRAPPKH